MNITGKAIRKSAIADNESEYNQEKYFDDVSLFNSFLNEFINTTKDQPIPFIKMNIKIAKEKESNFSILKQY